MAGQRQDRNDFETAATFSYQHIFSPDVVGDLRAMGRDTSANLWSNPLSTPILAYQQREYREQYVKGSVSIHSGRQEIQVRQRRRFRFDSRELQLPHHRHAQSFDPDTPLNFAFRGFCPRSRTVVIHAGPDPARRFDCECRTAFRPLPPGSRQSASESAFRCRVLLASRRHRISRVVGPCVSDPGDRKSVARQFFGRRHFESTTSSASL